MAPKKAAKKAAKKHLELDEISYEPGDRKDHRGRKHEDKKHVDKKQREAKDLRRAYEHLGRLSAMEKTLTGRTVTQVNLLTEFAKQSLLADDPKNAADLLRAAEHLAFGSLAQTSRATRLSEALELALSDELEHLAEKAADHWKKHDTERPTQIADLYASMLSIAEASRVKGAYRRALEFARGAEALAHTRGIRGANNPALQSGASLDLAGI